jgi:hypothetical protein
VNFLSPPGNDDYIEITVSGGVDYASNTYRVQLVGITQSSENELANLLVNGVAPANADTVLPSISASDILSWGGASWFATGTVNLSAALPVGATASYSVIANGNNGLQSNYVNVVDIRDVPLYTGLKTVVQIVVRAADGTPRIYNISIIGPDSFYVSNASSSSDASSPPNRGSAPGIAFKTMSAALAKASSGSVKKITVDGVIGDANGSSDSGSAFVFRGVGNAAAPFVLRGMNGAQLDAANSKRVLSVEDMSYLILEDIVVTHGAYFPGAGIQLDGGACLTLANGAKVQNNAATNWGGGIYIYPGCAVIMEDGSEISSNYAANSGGGVYISAGSSFTLAGGTITGNSTSTSGSGGGIYSLGNFKMRGNAQVNASNNVMLAQNAVINIAEDFSRTEDAASLTFSTVAGDYGITSYTTGIAVLTGNLSGCNSAFNVLPCSSVAYYINPNGFLYKVSSPGTSNYTYYVKATGDNSNIGSEDHPFKTLKFALGRPVVNNSDVQRIIILGELNNTSEHNGGAHENDSVFNLVNTTSIAKNFIISGKDAAHPAILNAGNDSGTGATDRVMFIAANVKVTFQHIVFTGGITTAQQGASNTGAKGWGGGLFIQSDTSASPTVTLGAGSVVTGNIANGRGNGIFAIGSTVKMIDGASVSFNGPTSASQSYGGVLGAGVSLSNATLSLTDAIIEGNIQWGPGNESGRGGGVYLDSGSILNLGTGAIISNNKLYGGSSQLGSAVFVKDMNSYVWIKSGSVIKGNRSGSYDTNNDVAALGGDWGARSFLFIGGLVEGNIPRDYPFSWGL